MKAKVLIIDDDLDFTTIFHSYLSQEGFDCSVLNKPKNLQKEIGECYFDFILLDVFLQSANGLDLLPKIRILQPYAKIVVITAQSSIPLAVSSMEAGALTFLEKTMDFEHIVECLKQRMNRNPHEPSKNSERSLGIIGSSPGIQQLIEQIHQIKNFDTNILILGESGTGKELVAKSIHTASRRSAQRFEAINCGAIPEPLLESELFGFRRGAFTDAKTDKKGLFEVCSGGTLFLDEIGEMPISMQVKILRALQEKEVRPLGSDKTLQVDTRIIAATHRNLEHDIKLGHFRPDLYYRLSVMPIHIPPLKERLEDIAPLAEFFVASLCSRYKISAMSLSKCDAELLKQYDWPGNIRELQNIIERAIITAKHGRLNFDSWLQSRKAPLKEQRMDGNSFVFNFDNAKQDFEKSYICRLLQNTRGNISDAAKLSGKFRSDIYRVISRYDINIEDFK